MKRILASGTAVLLLSCQLPVCAAEEHVQQLPLADGIVLSDNSGQIFIHVPAQEAVQVSVEKTEPEGKFTYYQQVSLEGSEETVYQMNLSHCEYLPTQEKYIGSYEITLTHFLDEKASAVTSFVVDDLDFQPQKNSVFHFYVTAERTGQQSAGAIKMRSSKMEEDVLVSIYDVTLQYTGYMRGDVDGNNLVDIQDAAVLLSWYAESAAELTDETLTGDGDVNRDGTIDIADAARILQYYAMRSAGMPSEWDE